MGVLSKLIENGALLSSYDLVSPLNSPWCLSLSEEEGSIPSSIHCFPQVGGNQVAEAPEVPPFNDSIKASLSPSVGRLHSFRRY